MPKTEQQLRQDIVDIGKLIYAKGWVAANDGNISYRLDTERVLCTPTGVSKGMMSPDDLIICDMKGNKLAGQKERTSEIEMHLTVFRMRPEINSVVHAHPPVATGYAASGKALNQALLPEVIIGLGCVPLAAYGLPGTPELTEPMLPLIPTYNAILLANHGAVCFGKDVHQAYFRMETVEHYARISLVTQLLGGATVLPRTEVEKLVEARTRYGIQNHARVELGCPVAAGETRSAPERFEVTRDELVALVNEALRAHGIV